MTDFDAVRAAHPALIVNLYAMTPGGAVTLEIITPAGETFTWQGVNAADAIARAFPATPEEPATAHPTIFD